ncbi:hypothetical protein Pelo_17707 [Pelomyxa schiedti]|nr:hypothetical protein Pelo_17707 [Pelomyxa schiedti]
MYEDEVLCHTICPVNARSQALAFCCGMLASNGQSPVNVMQPDLAWHVCQWVMGHGHCSRKRISFTTFSSMITCVLSPIGSVCYGREPRLVRDTGNVRIVGQLDCRGDVLLATTINSDGRHAVLCDWSGVIDVSKHAPPDLIPHTGFTEVECNDKWLVSVTQTGYRLPPHFLHIWAVVDHGVIKYPSKDFRLHELPMSFKWTTCRPTELLGDLLPLLWRDSSDTVIAVTLIDLSKSFSRGVLVISDEFHLHVGALCDTEGIPVAFTKLGGGEFILACHGDDVYQSSEEKNVEPRFSQTISESQISEHQTERVYKFTDSHTTILEFHTTITRID